MNRFEDQELIGLTPIHFFALAIDCFYCSPKEAEKKMAKAQLPYLLPTTSYLCDEKPFAEVAMGWNEDALLLTLKVSKSCSSVFFPEIRKGDSLELFIDTRDVKSSGYTTRFCHHFFFLPQAVDATQCGEMTHFRGEEIHPLCNPELLQMKVQLGLLSYAMQILIPKSCLYGYDPHQFDRLGFSYRVNRFNGAPQHFSVSDNDYAIEHQPSLWSSLTLKE